MYFGCFYEFLYFTKIKSCWVKVCGMGVLMIIDDCMFFDAKE
jgi:hypothetical protein